MKASGFLANASSLLGPFFVAVASACATVPDYLVDPVAHPHPSCPPEQNILALGSDASSSEAAVSAARSRVASQVSSSLKAHQEVARTVVASRSGGEQHARIEKQMRTVVDEQIAFAHGELLRTVGQPTRTSAGYQALVCLDRAAAASAVRADIEGDFAVVAQALRVAEESVTRGDIPGFVTASATANRHAKPVRQGLAQVGTLRGPLSSDERRVVEGLAWLAATSTRLRGETRMAVRIDSGNAAGSGAEAAPRLVLDAATAEGIAASLTDVAVCDAGPGALLVDVRVVSSCRRGTLGHTCSLSMPTTLRHCGSTTAVSSVDLAGPATGSDPREELAGRRAAAAAQAAIGPALRKLLSTEVPMDSP